MSICRFSLCQVRIIRSENISKNINHLFHRQIVFPINSDYCTQTFNPTMKSASAQVVRSGILSNTNAIVLFLKRVHVGVVSFIPGSKQPSASGFIGFTVFIFHGCSLLSWIVYYRADLITTIDGALFDFEFFCGSIYPAVKFCGLAFLFVFLL